VLLPPALAEAHQFGLSLVQLTVGDSSVEAEYSAALEHWDLAAGVDTNRDRKVSEAELSGGRDALLGYLRSRVHLVVGATECEATLNDVVYDAPKTAGHLYVTYECGVPLGTLVIENKAFREQPGNHQWIAIIAEGDQRHRVVFNRQNTQVTYEATPPEASEVVEQSDPDVEEASVWQTMADFVVL